jgi:hypothetical protein
MKTLFTNGRQEFTLPIPVKSLAEYETLKTIIHDDNQLKSDIVSNIYYLVKLLFLSLPAITHIFSLRDRQ